MCLLTLAPTDVFGKNEKKNKTKSGYRLPHNQSPLYVKDLLKPAANYALRSSAQSSLLFVPKVNRSTLGDRSFVHAAPVLWNSLPLTIRTSSSLAIFTKHLKTILFRKAFSLLE